MKKIISILKNVQYSGEGRQSLHIYKRYENLWEGNSYIKLNWIMRSIRISMLLVLVLISTKELA